ncbi:hypothetical protein ACGTI2_05195 [Morganella morganii]|uniref:hypothetical protein n=1 Tax=Morganella morganii TaxID=582 RepID=UPI00228BB6FF|nr:hypothetical protein [Morganella morganii]
MFMNIMILITVMVISFQLARFGVYYLLAFFFPSKYVNIIYKDKNGKRHSKKISLQKKDAEQLAITLSEIKKNSQNKERSN